MLGISRPARLVTLIIGVWYFIIGYGSATLDSSVPAQMRFAWRLAAWIGCGIAYAAHIAFLHFRLRKSPSVTALNAAIAVALGALSLAAAATVHATLVTSHAPYRQFIVALVVWPIITAVPAFVVAFVIAAALWRFPGKRLTE